MKSKKIFASFLFAVILFVTGCSNPAQAVIDSSDITWDQTSSVQADPARLLESLDGVVRVEPIKQNRLDADGRPQFVYRYKYLVIFRQPLDWKDSSAGTFDQRVIVGIDDLSSPNVVETEGYLLSEKKIENDPRNDQEVMLEGNCIDIEHRFFGESKPAGLSNDDTAQWEYLTTYNAASDQYKIITELKKILSGKWVATGRSKGGLTANMLSMYYPDAVDLTVSYVAPLCNENDDRFYRFVYQEAESVKYGEQERNLITDFQIEALKKRDVLKPYFEEYVIEEKATLRKQNTLDILFDVCVLETAVVTWQYYQEFDKIKECMAMPEGSQVEKEEKYKAMIEIIKDAGLETDTRSPYFPYFVQASKELGNYYYDFSFLRQALEERGMDASQYLAVKENHMYSAIDLLLTDAQKKAFVYDDTMNQKLKEWAETTDSQVIMIYGSSDPWYAVRVPDTDNQNIQIYVSERTPHTTLITDEKSRVNNDYSFEKEEQMQIIKNIRNIMKSTAE